MALEGSCGPIDWGVTLPVRNFRYEGEMWRKVSLALACASACLLSATSKAADDISVLASMCKATISRPSNSVTSLERQQWARTTTDGMCSTHFTDSTSFQSAAASLGVSIPVASGLFGLNGSSANSNKDVRNAYTNVCENHHYIDIGSNVSYLQSTEVTAAMAAAYKFCVEHLAHIFTAISQDGIVIQDFVMSGQNAFQFKVHDYAGAAIGRIMNVTGATTCILGGKKYVRGTPVDFTHARVEMNGMCQRRSRDRQSVSFDTNAGVSNSVDIPEVSSRIQTLSAEIATLRNRISSLQGKVVPKGAVVAFDRSTCPTGWAVSDITTGRVVVGDGVAAQPTISRKFRSLGGLNQIRLRIAQLPPHNPGAHNLFVGGKAGGNFPYPTSSSWGFQWLTWGRYDQNGFHIDTPVTHSVGQDAPVDIDQPYVALHYCVRQ